jgi:hypothetical protein
MQRLAEDPELGRHHDLRFTTLHSQHGPVALLDNRQIDQNESRPPITVHRTAKGKPIRPLSSRDRTSRVLRVCDACLRVCDV